MNSILMPLFSLRPSNDLLLPKENNLSLYWLVPVGYFSTQQVLFFFFHLSEIIFAHLKLKYLSTFFLIKSLD